MEKRPKRVKHPMRFSWNKGVDRMLCPEYELPLLLKRRIRLADTGCKPDYEIALYCMNEFNTTDPYFIGERRRFRNRWKPFRVVRWPIGHKSVLGLLYDALEAARARRSTGLRINVKSSSAP